MTDQATRVVPAGWYEDPASSAHVRWWNGLAWTEHTTLKPAEPPRPVAEPRVADPRTAEQHNVGQQTVTTATGSVLTAEMLARIAEARALEREYGISTAENDIIMRSAATGATGPGARDPLAASADASRRSDGGTGDTEAEFRRRYRRDDDEQPGTTTASAWFIALWPVLTLVAAIVAAYVAFYVAFEPSVAGIPLVAGLVIVPYLLTLVWAVLDSRRLRALGQRAPSPALALLGPLVYLIARRARVSGSGPLVTLIVLTLLAVGAPLAAHLTGVSAPATKALEIQQAIRADLVGSGQLASVSCPIFVESVTPGSLYTCNAVQADGRSRLVWVSIDTFDGDFSYALAVR